MHGKILTASCLFRGKNLSALEVESTIAKFKNKKESSFVEWIPDNMMNSICKVPAAASPGDISGTFLCNSTLINQSFDHLLQNFDKMLRAKAYVHWYQSEGMCIDEFKEAAHNLRDLVSEYQQYQDASTGDDAYDDGMEWDEVEFQKVANGSLQSNSTQAQSDMVASI